MNGYRDNNRWIGTHRPLKTQSLVIYFYGLKDRGRGLTEYLRFELRIGWIRIRNDKRRNMCSKFSAELVCILA